MTNPFKFRDPVEVFVVDRWWPGVVVGTKPDKVHVYWSEGGTHEHGIVVNTWMRLDDNTVRPAQDNGMSVVNHFENCPHGGFRLKTGYESIVDHVRRKLCKECYP